ncbi:unnamed protein product [Bursaphelenchus xylophilus]|uniref:(pine wood nematode) hypothetical protein n=1 Tax=Bursaphelenchus xylophilus TaxID=6326 RepID=A0A1I7RZY5_BURXY|nr:unnamed protein product [Bursaphelenchus xylophilus]CAG9109146.1 unnamed protein product [Bursaphelenchus xylophilus]
MFRASLLILILSVVTSFPTEYSTEATKEYFFLNAALFSTPASVCVDKYIDTEGEWKIIDRKTDSICDYLNQTCGYLVLRSDVYREYIVVYRGSIGRQVEGEVEETFLPQVRLAGGRVHLYFYTAQNSTWGLVSGILKTEGTKDYTVVFTGHSLGGAASVISAARAVEEGLKNGSQVAIWTFGQPRVGNSEFSTYIDDTFDVVYRVVNRRDIVPHIPPCFAKGLTGCFPATFGYYHEITEVWYPEGLYELNSTYQICTNGGEDPSCSNSLIANYSWDDHAGAEGYFNIDPAVYGSANCQD